MFQLCLEIKDLGLEASYLSLQTLYLLEAPVNFCVMTTFLSRIVRVRKVIIRAGCLLKLSSSRNYSRIPTDSTRPPPSLFRLHSASLATTMLFYQVSPCANIRQRVQMRISSATPRRQPTVLLFETEIYFLDHLARS